MKRRRTSSLDFTRGKTRQTRARDSILLLIVDFTDSAKTCGRESQKRCRYPGAQPKTCTGRWASWKSLNAPTCNPSNSLASSLPPKGERCQNACRALLLLLAEVCLLRCRIRIHIPTAFHKSRYRSRRCCHPRTRGRGEVPTVLRRMDLCRGDAQTVQLRCRLRQVIFYHPSTRQQATRHLRADIFYLPSGLLQKREDDRHPPISLYQPTREELRAGPQPLATNDDIDDYA